MCSSSVTSAVVSVHYVMILIDEVNCVSVEQLVAVAFAPLLTTVIAVPLAVRFLLHHLPSYNQPLMQPMLILGPCRPSYNRQVAGENLIIDLQASCSSLCRIQH